MLVLRVGGVSARTVCCCWGFFLIIKFPCISHFFGGGVRFTAYFVCGFGKGLCVTLYVGRVGARRCFEDLVANTTLTPCDTAGICAANMSIARTLGSFTAFTVSGSTSSMFVLIAKAFRNSDDWPSPSKPPWHSHCKYKATPIE